MDKKDLNSSKRKTSIAKTSSSAAKSTNNQNKNMNINATKGKKGKKNKKTGWKIFRVCLFIFIALCIIGAGVVFGVITGIIDKTETVSVEEIQQYKLTSVFYSANGNEVDSIHDEENRISVEYKDIPKNVVNAVVAIEDERFFEHHGIDIKRTLGAIVTYILNGGDSSFGGSTLTQQLVKNVTNDTERNWTRKIREWYNAIQVEQKLSKDQIFEAYVNKIYMGEGAYGFEVAAQTFFSKDLKDVNLAEAAILAAQIQSPEATNPYRSEEAKQKLLDRQKVVLNKMLELGMISQEEHDEAVNTEVVFKKSDASVTSAVKSYFIEAVIDEIIADLQEEKNYSRAQAIDAVYNSGLKIYTTMDESVQNAINEAYNNPTLFYTDRAGDFMQSAMVVIDQSNGNVLGLIGGADEKTGNLVTNRATDVPRQPGSCMKPIGAYGPAFERGVSSPATGVDDSQLTTVSGYDPHNYYNHFNGYVTVREAIADSMNLPALRTLMKVDIDYAFSFAKNLGLKHLVSADENKQTNDEGISQLALGGLTKGATVMEMANAYATIANGGLYIEPKLYTKVLDRNGKELLINNSEAKRVMSDSTAYMLTSCMESVNKAGGTGYGHVRVRNIAVAGKTGNTNDDYDQWYCGFTPYYTIACWNGYTEVGGKAGKKAIGTRKWGSYPYTSVKLFNTVMNSICSGKEAKQFTRPDSVIEASVCRDSGLVATDSCRTDPRGDRTITDLFAKGKVPTNTCTVHKTVKICTVSNKIATSYCPSTVDKSFITRDETPAIKPRDWGYMLPTATCDIHTTPQSSTTPGDDDENNGNDIVDVYKENNNKNKRN